MTKGAVISPCARYRYRLWRKWDAKKPTLVFVMLNPSTADGEKDDPTIRKCVGFAERLGFGAIEVVNLFAWRATDPKALKKQSFMSDAPIVGPENDQYLMYAAERADKLTAKPRDNGTVVAAWGAHAKDYAWRVSRVRDILSRCSKVQCLGTTKAGLPRHPLMLAYTTSLEGYVG